MQIHVRNPCLEKMTYEYITYQNFQHNPGQVVLYTIKVKSSCIYSPIWRFIVFSFGCGITGYPTYCHIIFNVREFHTKVKASNGHNSATQKMSRIGKQLKNVKNHQKIQHMPTIGPWATPFTQETFLSNEQVWVLSCINTIY